MRHPLSADSDVYKALLRLRAGKRVDSRSMAALRRGRLAASDNNPSPRGMLYLAATGMGVSRTEAAMLAILFIHRRTQGGGPPNPADRDLLRRFAAKSISDSTFDTYVSCLRKKGLITYPWRGAYLLTDAGMELCTNYAVELEVVETDLFAVPSGQV